MSTIVLKVAVPQWWVESVRRVLDLSPEQAEIVARRLWLA